MKRRIRWIGVLALASAMTPGGTGSAAAQTCPPLGLTCTVDDVVDNVGDTVDDTVDDATETVDDTVDTVGNTVDDLLNPGEEPPPPGGGGGGTDPGPGGGSGGDGNGANHGGNDPRYGDDRPGSPNSAGSDDAGSRRDGATSDVTTTIGGPVRPVVEPVATGTPSFVSSLEDAAPSLLVVSLLLGLSLAFATVQDRLDRRDPRLRLAPLEAEVVAFS